MEVKIVQVSAKQIRLEIDGVLDSVGNWAKKFGIPEPTLRLRLKRGADLLLGDAWASKDYEVKIYGVVKTLQEWSEREGIPYSTIKNRYIAGKRGEDLISTKGLKKKLCSVK